MTEIFLNLSLFIFLPTDFHFDKAKGWKWGYKLKLLHFKMTPYLWLQIQKASHTNGSLIGYLLPHTHSLHIHRHIVKVIGNVVVVVTWRNDCNDSCHVDKRERAGRMWLKLTVPNHWLMIIHKSNCSNAELFSLFYVPFMYLSDLDNLHRSVYVCVHKGMYVELTGASDIDFF